ncbi:MAG: hypothetical protein B6244_07295 [Candidatus Cloacimonetes bacterium 4572_55]|nr:MAG: hypothetical protein B6244_07295 [Candidatus Cloacimonetes bacterium 4572_55]
MKRNVQFLLLLTIIFSFFIGTPLTAAMEQDESITVIASMPDQVAFRFQLETVTVKEQEVQGSSFARYGFKSATYRHEPGEPLLPFKRVAVAVPPNSVVSLTTRITESTVRAGLPPLPAPTIHFEEDGSANEKWSVAPGYRSRTFNRPLAVAGELEMFRFQQLVYVDVFPVQYQGQGEVTLINSMEVTVSWSPGSDPIDYGPAPPDPFGEPLYRRLVVNYDQAQGFRFIGSVMQKAGGRDARETDVIFEHSDRWMQIEIADEYNEDAYRYADRNLVYRVTGQDLQDAGADISEIDLDEVRLFGNGSGQLPTDVTYPARFYRELPIQLSRQSGTVSPDDYLLFYGLSQTGFKDEFTPGEDVEFYENPYDHSNYYWLTWGGDFEDQPKRIESRTQTQFSNPLSVQSFTDYIHVEDNWDWLTLEGGRLLDDDWVWEFLIGRGTPGGDNYSYPINLIDKSPQSNETTVVLAFQRKVTQGHPVTFYLNNLEIGSHIWTATHIPTAYIESFTGSYAVNGQNTLRIQMTEGSPTSPDQVYLGWFSLSYQRQFRAYENRLKFRSPEATVSGAHYEIDNFSGGDIMVWDVTDPFSPTTIDADIAGTTISFQDSVFSDKKNIYYAVSSDGFMDVTAIEEVVFPTSLLHDTSREVDYLIIAPEHFHDGLEPLADQRRVSLVEALVEGTPNPVANPQVEIVDSRQVYNEFSSGYTDPGAIRNCLKYALENWSRPPMYVLFVSDASRDYRNYRHSESPVLNYIPTFQFKGVHTYASDDWMVWLNSGRSVDMVNGRFPVETEAELEILVDKVLEYEIDPEWGRWRNRMIVLSDDYCQPSGCHGNQIYFTTNENDINNEFIPNQFDHREIFLVEYPLDPNETTKVAAHDDFVEALNQGAVMVRYTGHGGPAKMADENAFNIVDIPHLENGKRLAIWGGFSCDLANFDHYEKECIAEDLVLADNKGAVAMVAGIRSTYGGPNRTLEEQFLGHLFEYPLVSMGAALALGKINTGTEQNSSKYIFMGDPAQLLANPRMDVQFDNPEDIVIQEANAITVSGGIYENGALQADLNGSAFLTIFADRDTIHYTDSSYGVDETWDHVEDVLYRGSTLVENGRFSQTGFIPDNIELGQGGRISLYAWDEASMIDASGALDGIPIVSGTISVEDSLGPEITVFLDGNILLSAGVIYPGSVLKVKINDNTGVNLSGSAEAGVFFDLILPRESEYDPVTTVLQKDLTPYFEYDSGNYRQGSLEWEIKGIDTGRYLMRIRAIDNMNNLATVEYQVDVRISASDSYTIVEEMFNYPNPSAGRTDFLFKVNEIDASAIIKIYTVAGRLIRSLGPDPTVVSPGQSRISWDGLDEDGDQIANGVYLYKLIAEYEGENGQERRFYYGKLMMRR